MKNIFYLYATPKTDLPILKKNVKSSEPQFCGFNIPPLLMANILCGIQAVNYIVAVWDCQAERNRSNKRASYAWKKAAEAENKE
ncbi:MAG TPA: hypothetical protein DCX82_00550 [Lachnospiraceae bacterium]|nr:hypothetical protein [Lachnospiraceae bacterium]